jgi:murein DD-endopeptidase MepM/ murein hydrolase activator NlpD
MSQGDASKTVQVRVIPDTPFLEHDIAGQYLNCDFRITNQTGELITLTGLELSVFDKAGQLASRRFLSTEGATRPGIETVPRREINAGAEVDMFNPFHTLDPVLAVETLRFAFQFKGSQLYTTDVVVHPISYHPKTTIAVPLKDRFIVYDGHDYYSHHRRLDLSSPALKRLGLGGNPVRFAYDFSPVNDRGKLYPADSPTPEHWFAYGRSVYAPAAGLVVSAANSVADNKIENGKLVMADAGSPDLRTVLLGNHVVIDHGNGEYSFLAHLKAGTVLVKVGDRVRQGQSLGQIGFSGDTGSHVHLHYHLANGTQFDSAGLPVYFRDYRRILGASSIGIDEGLLHTGDLIQAR